MCRRAGKRSATSPNYSAGSPATWDIRLSRSYAVRGICAEISYCVDFEVSSNRRMIIETCRSIFVVRLILFTEIPWPFKIACHVLLSPHWSIGPSDIKFPCGQSYPSEIGLPDLPSHKVQQVEHGRMKVVLLIWDTSKPRGHKKATWACSKIPTPRSAIVLVRLPQLIHINSSGGGDGMKNGWAWDGTWPGNKEGKRRNGFYSDTASCPALPPPLLIDGLGNWLFWHCDATYSLNQIGIWLKN